MKKEKRIIKDLIKLYPEFGKNKKTLKKTVHFLSTIEPEVKIDTDFKLNLQKRLEGLIAIKKQEKVSLMKKNYFHIFGWVFASFLAAFALFYVFGDSLFYTWINEKVEQSTQMLDVNTTIENDAAIEPEVIPVLGTESSDDETLDSTWEESVEVVEKTTPSQKTLPIENIGFPIHDTTVQDTEPDILEVQRKAPVESESWATEVNALSESIESTEETTPEETLVSPTEQVEIQEESIWEITDFATDDAMDATESMNPAAGSMMSPASMMKDSAVIDNVPDAIGEEILDIEEESLDEVIDEFTLRCDVFWWKVSIIWDERVCNIGDIVCQEDDFLKWVCELGQ